MTVMRDGKRVKLKVEVGLLEDEEVAAAAAETEAPAEDGAAPPADRTTPRRCSA